jgi:hypothetical protein
MHFQKPLAPPVEHVGSQKALECFFCFHAASSRIKTSHHLWWWYLTGLVDF